MHLVRPLPVAPRPFPAEALGSWIGRLAARYRMAVRQLDSDYGLGLTMTGPLFWLLPGPMSEDTRARLAWITRTRAEIISSLTVAATTATRWGAPYCRRCVFLNPIEVESPYWKREWLSPEALVCTIHRTELTTLPARRVRQSGNMMKLLRTVGKYEQERSGWHFRRY